MVARDADLQDPPDLLPEMVALYRQGFDVVSARRVGREGEGRFNRATAAVFYALTRHAVDERLWSGPPYAAGPRLRPGYRLATYAPVFPAGGISSSGPAFLSSRPPVPYGPSRV